MRKRRTFFFLASIVIGGLIGIGYGWWLRPRLYSEAGLSNLREDFRADYVLMTAEIYRQENDLAAARAQLELLGNNPLDLYTNAAILTAGQLGYGQSDLQLLTDLNLALSTENQTPVITESPQP